MVNRLKALGTAAETAVARYLQDHGFGGAERRSLAGAIDKGDVTGTPGLAWEVKAGRTLCLSQWLRETEKERVNAKADFGILVIKPSGFGVTRVGKWWAVMYRDQWQRLCLEIDSADCTPEVDATSLSGARITDLRDVMRRLPEPRYAGDLSFLPHVMINPKGIKDPMRFYVVTTVDQMVTMVRMAGYGDPYVTE